MKKTVRVAVAACALSLMTAAGASAEVIGIGESVGFEYEGLACSDCSALATFELLDSTHLQIDLTNTSGDDDNNWLTQLSVLTSPDITVTSANFGALNGLWEFNDLNGNLWTFNVKTKSGINNALANQGGSLSVVLTFMPSTNQLEFLDSQIHWQNTTNSEDSDKSGPPTTVVPEPATLGLLTLGLLGFGAAGRREQTGIV